MNTISIEQSRKRFRRLPAPLQDAIFSVQTAEIISQVCEKNSVPSGKISVIAKAVGLVLLGFIHPEDLPGEIADKAGLAPQAAKTISDDLAARIFSALKSDLDKSYAPVPHEEDAQHPIAMQDISPIPSGPGPKVMSQSVAEGAAPSMSTAPLASNATKAAEPPKRSFESTGWSRATAEQPIVQLQRSSAPPPQNTAAAHVAQIVKPAAIPISGPVGEFERISIQGGQKKVVPPAAAAPAVPAPSIATAAAKPAQPPAAPASGPAPMIIHEDAAFKPAQQPPNFHLQVPTSADDILKGQAMPQPPLRSAILELGKIPSPPAPPKPSSTPRVVHYTEYKSPVAGSGPRNITELTSPAPQTPSAPKPPAPPAPPQK